MQFLLPGYSVGIGLRQSLKFKILNFKIDVLKNFSITTPTALDSGVSPLDITEIYASVIQRSAIGPASYVVNAGDLRPIMDGNDVLKYADDT